MPRESFPDVDTYIASFPESTRHVLSQVRATVRAAAPQAQELISYQIPCYKVGKWRLYFAGFKGHYSLFVPSAEEAIAAFGPELADHHVSKATFHFSLAEPVPVALFEKVVSFSLSREQPEPPKRSRVEQAPASEGREPAQG